MSETARITRSGKEMDSHKAIVADCKAAREKGLSYGKWRVLYGRAGLPKWMQ